jgi:hypothetical protein
VVVHLLRELPRQLDGLDIRAKCPPENALEEGLDFLFESAKDH